MSEKNEGLLKKRIQKIEENKFQFPVVDNRLKVVVQDMINMNREHDVVAVLAILDEAAKEIYAILGSEESAEDQIFDLKNVTKKWFGEAEK